jgi:YVTN family beta-propeller protein
VSELPTGTVTFLFTDIEGSTQLLRRLGPAYAGLLAEHQRIVRAAAAAHHGREVDTQGDAFFIAFRRGKDAVAAAVAIQRDLAAHPWPEGGVIRLRIGLHTGEPQVGEDRYVGMGVNKAARIGAAGHGGQVLISRTTRDLVEDELPPGVTIRDLGDRRLKDIERPEHIFQLVIEGLQSEFGQLKTLDVELAKKRRRLYAGAALIGVLAAAVAIPIFAFGSGGGGGGSANVEPNSLAIIDPGSDRVVGSVSVGIRPGSLAAGAGSIWVANIDDRTLSRIDPKSDALQRNYPLEATPTGLAYGSGAIWIANGLLGSVSRFDPSVQDVTGTQVEVTGRSSAGSAAVGEGHVWAVFGNSILGKIDPRKASTVATGIAGSSPSAIAVGEGAVWVANSGDNTVSRVLPETATTLTTITVGRQPSGIAVADGVVWIADRGENLVTRYDARSGSQTNLAVGAAPIGVAVGGGFVWVANSDDGTVSKIDPGTREVVATIGVGGRPVGVLFSDGRVWVSVQAPA